ncbi:retrotransposon protein [Trifolium medium]|uniref:Retrotransposon protein n=1 Tax=Trifolium medium TaxID=97028 RepID=A0A392LY41_9FABA|nr:retrotransposon protein [Trifolium medium]
MYILALNGPDVVLGTPWLKTLGPRLVQQEPTTQIFSLSIIKSVTTPPQFPIVKHVNPNINHILTRYAPLFNEPTHLPPPRFTGHKIRLIPNAAPVNVRPYRYPHAQKLEIELQVQKLLKNGWIQPSNSFFSSPVLLLKKKDGTWRICVDYRALNDVTIKDRFPLPTVDELLDELGSARVFSKLDLTSGFHRIRLQPHDRLKTAFHTHDGHYEYKVMPFGLCNAPATFQATMNDIFRPLLRKTVIVFFDDISVYSSNEEQHVKHLEHVFQLLSEHQLYLKAPKCSFSQSQIDYLGHVVAKGTVAPDPSKVSEAQLALDRLKQKHKSLKELARLSVGDNTYELKQELLLDPLFLELRHQCLSDPNSLPDYQVVDGLLLRRGYSKTMKRLSENFYWDNMKKEAQIFIRQCVVCQQTKYSSQKPNGLLQPLPLPNHVWEDVFMDFVTGLPPSKGFTVIMVVVDRFSKGIHFGALATGFTAYKVAELFVSMVCKLHSLPKSIAYDCDPVFISRFWLDLFKFSVTLLRMSSSYHPQTDGQTEVMNRTVEQYLHAFVHEKLSQWFSLLPWAEYRYNTSIHAASCLSPFQVMFGKVVPSIPAYITGTSSIDACDAVLTSRDEILALLRKKLAKAQLQSYRQVSISGVKYHKLAKRYYGPYLIMAKIGVVAYKLALPPHSKIHNVFHCSLLKLHEGPPPSNIDQMVEGLLVRFALVQWRGLLPDDTSWERWDDLCQVHNLEDKVGFVGGDIDFNQSKSPSPTKSTMAQQAKIEAPRAKRVSKFPKSLEDYVTHLEASAYIPEI